MIALFIVGFFFMFVSFTAGILGCWKTSPSNITASAILMLIACLFHAGGMGLWHGVEHWERNKIMTNSDTEKTLPLEKAATDTHSPAARRVDRVHARLDERRGLAGDDHRAERDEEADG